tara:strand:+ start:993 stop:1166 length:174 start_codon:yes stop_codon:yes gene_type:complete
MDKIIYLVVEDKTKEILKEYKTFNNAQNYIIKHKLFGDIATIIEVYNYNKKTFTLIN